MSKEAAKQFINENRMKAREAEGQMLVERTAGNVEGSQHFRSEGLKHHALANGAEAVLALWDAAQP